MKTILVVFLAFLAIFSLALAQEQQQNDAELQQSELQQYAQQMAGVSPQWFISHPFFFPHPFIRPPHFPVPHFPSLPPMSAPEFPFRHPVNPPKHPDVSPCMDDFRSFLKNHKLSLSSGCCSVLKDVQIPAVKAFVSKQCSGSSS